MEELIKESPLWIIIILFACGLITIINPRWLSMLFWGFALIMLLLKLGG